MKVVSFIHDGHEKCWTHDGHKKCSKIKDLPAINEERIRKAKTIRETFNDENYHKKQWDTIPVTINHEVYGVHVNF